MKNWLQGAGAWLNLFLESRCPLCQRSTPQIFCPDCQRQVQYCQIPAPQLQWHNQPPLLIWGTYGGALKRAIASLKYENQPQIAQPLGTWLGQAWIKAIASHPCPPLTVVPIPLYKTKEQERGYNQAELLGRSFCTVTGLRLEPQALERVRQTSAQFSLAIAEREQNLAGAFRVGDAYCRQRTHTPVLLLDDIYTTGATIRSAVQTLRSQGISVYGCVAVASSQKR